MVLGWFKITTRVHTGGRKTFVYTGEERYEDTEPTKKFKEKYREWSSQPGWSRPFYSYQPIKLIRRKPSSLIIPSIIAIIIICLFVKWSNDGTFERFGVKVSEVKEDFTSDMKEASGDIKNKVENKIEEIEQNKEERNKEYCKEALQSVNRIRNKVGISSLQWSEELYDIALKRAKDMVERNYFSHYTPEGYDVGHYLGSSFGFSENIGEGYYSCQETVEGWSNSIGHYQNLLFGTYGAIARYSDVYVYISVS